MTDRHDGSSIDLEKELVRYMVEHRISRRYLLERIALVCNRKAPDRDAVDVFHSGRPFIFPGHVVAGTRGHDFDLCVASQPFGDVPRMKFGAAVDVRAIALDGDRELHDSEPSPPFESTSPPLEPEFVAGE